MNMKESSKKKDKNDFDSPIKTIADLFGEPDEKELADNMKKAKNSPKKSNYLNSIFIKYEKKKIDKETCKNIIY